MKKTIFTTFFVLVSLIPARLSGNESKNDYSCFDLSFSAGYVFKNDSNFKEVYGHGIVNAITADGCFYPWQHWGLGAKLSYWRTKGRTVFLQQRSILQELPATFYVRRRKIFPSGLQLYGSFGGGVIWLKEKSYVETIRLTKGIGELEIGLQYPIWRFINLVGAFRYLFPPQSYSCDNKVLGGFDLRAGIGFSF